MLPMVRNIMRRAFSRPPPKWNSMRVSRIMPASEKKRSSPQAKPGLFHVIHKVTAGDSPYVRAKHVQLIEKDPSRAISPFCAAMNSRDRVDSALKDMAVVTKQLVAIEAVKSFRYLCPQDTLESLDNVLVEPYKVSANVKEKISAGTGEEAKPIDFVKKGYEIVQDELTGISSRRKRIDYEASPSTSTSKGERSTRTEVVVVPVKQSRFSKWETLKEKMQGHPIFKLISGLSEQVVIKIQEVSSGKPIAGEEESHKEIQSLSKSRVCSDNGIPKFVPYGSPLSPRASCAVMKVRTREANNLSLSFHAECIHTRQNFNYKISPSFPCLVCIEKEESFTMYTSRDAVEMHYENKQDSYNNDGPIHYRGNYCEDCGNGFIDKDQLKEHMKECPKRSE